MEALIPITLFASIVVALGALAARFGADSREGVGDDHARPVGH
jgi:hypothetical protein